MTKANHLRLPILALTLALALPAAAAAQDEPWPTHPVRLIAASGPGGNPDVLARLLAEKFTNTFGKPFVVENVPGAGGIVAANMVAKAPPDGHVLMFGDSGAMAINPALNANLGYDPIKDFAPITALVSLPTIMALIESGKLRGYCVSVLQRSPSTPAIPTCDELGHKGFNVATVMGLHAPAGTSPKVVARLQAEVATTMREPSMAARMKQLGM